MAASQFPPDTWIEPLNRSHSTRGFDCGEPALNEYLLRYALKNQKRGIAKAYVAIPERGSHEVLGFYTLSAGAITFEDLPAATAKGIPKYPVPIARLGKMGVRIDLHGGGLGTFMFSDAMNRVLQAAKELGIFALVVDAKNETAKKFYLRFGLTEFQDAPFSLFLPVETILKAITG